MKKPICVALEGETIEALDERAKVEDRSRSWLVERLVRAGLQATVPDVYHEKVVNREHLFGPGVERWKVPGSPERYPHRIVNDEEQEAAAIADGYRANGVVQAPVAREVPENYSGPQYPKFVASHGKIVNSEAEELALMSDAERAVAEAERAVAEAERAKRMPVLADFSGDADRYGQALAAWLLAQANMSRTPAYTPAQALSMAKISESRWQALISQGYLFEADKCSPDAITRAVAARDAAV
jgi:hypothetical protein